MRKWNLLLPIEYPELEPDQEDGNHQINFFFNDRRTQLYMLGPFLVGQTRNCPEPQLTNIFIISNILQLPVIVLL